MDEPRLRRYTPADAAVLHAAVRASQASLGRWLPWAHADYSLDDAHRFIAAAVAGWASGAGPFEFAVTVGDALAGGVRVRCIEGMPRVGNLGYWIRSDLARRGLATVAARMAACIAFGELGMQRLEIVAAAANRASRRVAEKLGAHWQGPADRAASEPGHQASERVYLLTPDALTGAPIIGG